ncbi:SPRY domain-containing SOCS box protein 3-like [Asterias rubens]|uniref:SPRY domain-containing SOCS box protein 3-like n=1 Tax=Asterias rubens TaxID=7604 RepID=UPI0014554E38|nr:SPRY domain-containing SOCS box protein 3-like [Asterias rubens]
MTNNKTKNASDDTSASSETDSQPKPSKRARTNSGNATPGTVGSLASSAADHGAMATAAGLAPVTPLRDNADDVSGGMSTARRVRQSLNLQSTAGGGEGTRHSTIYTGMKLLTDDDGVGEGGKGEKGHSSAKNKSTSSSSNICRPEWIWDEQMMSDACIQAQESKGAQVCFHQDYSCGTAAARGLQPMAEGQHYWEIQMDSPVYGTAMMIGIGTGQIDLCQYAHTFCNMLGSDTNNESCGLSYTGRFYHGGAHGRSYCTKFGQGTVIGVHLDMWFGTLTFYQNGKCLGIATKGLLGKVWYPMISSTAARSSMCLQTARSFPSSLQFWCCRTLRRAIPAELNVVEALDLAPGMRAFLEDNLMWLLDSHSSGDVDVLTRGTQTDLSMATHQLSNVPLRRQSPDAGITSEGQGSSSPS